MVYFFRSCGCDELHSLGGRLIAGGRLGKGSIARRCRRRGVRVSFSHFLGTIFRHTRNQKERLLLLFDRASAAEKVGSTPRDPPALFRSSSPQSRNRLPVRVGSDTFRRQGSTSEVEYRPRDPWKGGKARATRLGEWAPSIIRLITERARHLASSNMSNKVILISTTYIRFTE